MAWSTSCPRSSRLPTRTNPTIATKTTRSGKGSGAKAFVYAEAARLEQDLLGRIEAAGVAVNEADKDAFIAASKAVYDEYGSEVAGASEMISKAQSLAK